MSARPIIDAGPALNFFSINRERLLLATLGPISAPETVRDEVMRKARSETRFRPAEKVWKRLPERLLLILPDDETPELNAAVTRLCGLPMAKRARQGKDLGELMVIAHAVVAAEAGHLVTVLIDDGEGARLATSEIRRLDRLRAAGRPFGTVRLVNTCTGSNVPLAANTFRTGRKCAPSMSGSGSVTTASLPLRGPTCWPVSAFRTRNGRSLRK